MRMKLTEHLQSSIEKLREENLLRAPPAMDQVHGPEIEIDGKRVLGFCSNDYLGLAQHPRLAAALKEGAERYGAGASASRLVAGNLKVHLELEERLASFVQLPAARFFSTGYAANVGVISALMTERDLIVSDKLNHASLIDGARLSKARVVVFEHGDVEHAEKLLREHRKGAQHALLVTESVFSMDGDEAPLQELRALCDRYDAWLMVDEAHALGVLGPEGRGLCYEQSIQPEILVGTLGKSFGLSGAFVAGLHVLATWLENRARSYVFSTAPAPALSHAALLAVQLVEQGKPLRATLQSHIQKLRSAFVELGVHVPKGRTPIVPLLIGDAEKTMQLSQALLEQGFFVQGIRPPTVPKGTSRLRLVPTATHTDAHVEALIRAYGLVTIGK